MQILKELKWNNIIASILMIVLGIVLLIFPSLSLSVITNMIGIAAIIGGLFSIIKYFTLDLKDSFYRNDFLFGIIILTLGILIMFKPAFFISLIPFILGIAIIFSGFVKLQDGIDAKRMGYDGSILYIILAIIDIIFGIVILFDPFSAAGVMFMIIGIGLIYSGVSDLYTTLYLSKKFKNFYNDKLE